MASRRQFWAAVACLPTVVCGACSVDSPDPNPHFPTATLSGVVNRAAHTATTLAPDTVLVAGGCDTDGCATATGTAFVLGGSGATPVGSLRTARDAHTATRLSTGQVLAVGGFPGEDQPPVATAELFDPDTQRWQPTGAMAQGRGGHVAAALGGGGVAVCGGWVGPHRFTATTEIYDPLLGRFRPGPSLPEAVDSLAAVSLPDGTVLVTGGQSGAGKGSRMAVLIDRDGRGARRLGPLRQARFKHTMVSLASGRVLIIGGTSDDHTLLASTEIYDPRTHEFTEGPTMSAGRYKLTGAAAVLPDDRVVVAGGGPGLELIDVAAGRSRRVTATTGYAAFSTATVLDDRIRVVGGYDRAINLTRTDQTILIGDL